MQTDDFKGQRNYSVRKQSDDFFILKIESTRKEDGETEYKTLTYFLNYEELKKLAVSVLNAVNQQN